MRRPASLLLVMLLSVCSVLQGMPQPASSVVNHLQEICRDQSNGLQRLGTVSALARGSPGDVLAEIHAKAVAARVDYYVVLLVDEAIMTGQ